MNDLELIALASCARENAYAPYSKFLVGAALLADDGLVFTGCNIENISYGLTMCAERVAIGVAIQSGHRRFTKIAIVADSKEAIVPCGACRQVLAEFNSSLEVFSSNLSGVIQVLNLETLLPRSRQGILN
ncbi:MAG: cytidine deaminase [Chthoniobacterales bacterium]